ncbi:MAG TPA: MdtA/MuxA family multidrug efflux RND transporter periplasmic adaptor subunit [Smithella sp.]|nr:MdtA/MuxA family multidrug efflux RND transporter periplasmic adaptor subunit [Smithella sp.]
MKQTSELESNGESGQTGMQKFFHFVRRHWVIFLVAIVIILIVFRMFIAPTIAKRRADKQAQEMNQRPQPVTAVTTRKADFDVYLKALGTVTPINTVAVKSQVGGQLMSVNFKEGQLVKKGDLLAEIDPRPFQVQLMQAEGQLAKDEEFLRNAESDLAQYKILQKQDSIAVQQVTTQESLVKQYRGIIQTDKGVIANDKLQLIYARILAPLTGRVGLRQVDPGNMVQVNDANYPNGIVVITQLQPITVVFSVPQDNLPIVLQRISHGDVLPVFAYDQEGKVMLASGRLLAADNQIDTTTGTIKLKAIFDNKDNKLFANQFVNIKLKVDTLPGATVMSTAAVQRGSIGTFAYVVKVDKSVTVRTLKLGPTEGDNVAVTDGLAPGELVVTVGGDKLREGSKVEVIMPEGKNVSGQPQKKVGGLKQKK